LIRFPGIVLKIQGFQIGLPKTTMRIRLILKAYQNSRQIECNWDVILNREKHLSNGESPGHGITHVPSFVLSRNNIEIGRIVERPEQILEIDLCNHIKNNP